ncbi:hypothetical protein SAMN05444004_11322 [Jannaschia faecimaris]|uniref:Antibiotic biosynthesis monooxygenase n=1 Tax=Jannaschia faecimaris TaxID=1244108 RepID=A0A1H3SQ50_9RHOB|nr:hypothetical protein [Jannaschia faecimaris]SDZ40054.1 hypothetical protein SAMN05444004_11322 [Jannaschia faecimaris]
MPKHIIETVMFKLNEGVTREDFAQAAQSMSAYVTGCAGFIARRLSCEEDGTWIEHIEWTDMDAAKAAAAGLGTDPGNAECLSAIDGSSVKMSHSELEISVN